MLRLERGGIGTQCVGYCSRLGSNAHARGGGCSDGEDINSVMSESEVRNSRGSNMRQVLEGHPNGKAWASSVLRVQKLGQQRRSTSKHVLTGYMLSWYKGMSRDSTVIPTPCRPSPRLPLRVSSTSSHQGRDKVGEVTQIWPGYTPVRGPKR